MPEQLKQGYIAFHKGKAHPLSAISKDAAQKEAAKHFGVPKSKSWQIHIEDAPVDGGSNP